MLLIEVGDCVFDKAQFGLSRGSESLDAVAQEAFVNHLHLTGEDRADAAIRVIAGWAAEMRTRWPERTFRIYRAVELAEVTIRFHVVRPGLADWCDSGLAGVEVITVGPSADTVQLRVAPARRPAT